MPNGLFTLKQVNAAVQQGAWPNQKTPAVDYLVVAGGGGGGYISAAGAGGLLQGNIPVAAGSAITVTVGAGGTGRTTGGGVSTNGSNSVFSSITSIGGGAGVYNNDGSGASGGSGASNGVNAFGAVGQGTAGQGNAGGLSLNSGGSYYGGGGGGAGTTGIAAYNGACGAGGSGIASAISGTITAYAGGGGGSHAYGANPGAGGVGGGGAGGGAANGTSGTANTGGGGGSSSYTGSYWDGGNGGSGIVILSYPDVYAAPTATTGSPTVTTSGSGSISLNGGSANITSNNSAAFNCAGDFTLEAWIYPTSAWSTGFYNPILYVNGNGFYFGQNSAGFGLRQSGVSNIISYGTSPTINTWTHVAIVRSGSTITMYYNGTSVATATSSVEFTSGEGRFGYDASYGYAGYLSNFRITKSAVYTANFTPSTTPLAAIANTTVLLNSVSSTPFLDSSASGLTFTLTGSPAWNASSPFTVAGYKNRVYKWTSSGSITF